MRSAFRVTTLTVLAAAASGRAAEREWRPFAAGFVGLGRLANFDLREENPDAASKLLFEGISARGAAEFGAHLGVWRLGPNGNDLAFRLVALHAEGGSDDQVVPVFGVAAGAAVDERRRLPALDLATTSLIADFLLRTRHHGRFEPYGGAGAGLEHARLTTRGEPGRSDWTGIFTAVGGAQIRLSRRTALFGEYRHQWSRHEYAVGPARRELSSGGHHLDAGVAIDLR